MSSDQSEWERLCAWADSCGLEVRTYPGTQREPENAAMVLNKGGMGGPIVKRISYDGVEQAVHFLLHDLERLGVEVP